MLSPSTVEPSVGGDLRLKLKANVMAPSFSSTVSLAQVPLLLPIRDSGLPNRISRSYSFSN